MLVTKQFLLPTDFLFFNNTMEVNGDQQLFDCSHHSKYSILTKVLGHPLLIKGLTTLVISMSTDLNV